MEGNLSFWEKQSFYPQPQLLIVGAGIVGLCASIFYKKKHPDRKVVVIDEHILPKGASTRNAGFACFGSMTELLSDLELQGESLTLEILENRWKGLLALRQLVGDGNMDFQQTGAYELFLEKDKLSFNQVKDKIQWINKRVDEIIGEKDTFSVCREDFAISKIDGLVFNKAEGQLNPGKMVHRLIEIARELKVEFIRGLRLKSLETLAGKVNCQFEKFSEITAEQVLIATNGFSKKLLPDLDVLPVRNQVLLTSPIDNLKLKGCFHYDRGYIYFRNVENRLLLGGGRNWDLEKEQTAEYGANEKIKDGLIAFLNEHLLPKAEYKIDFEWSGILGVGSRKKPIIKKLNNNLGVAVRLGGMGVAIGCRVGQQAAEMMS